MYTIRNPLYYLRKLVLASKVERLSIWNAIHLVHFSLLLDYCPIWFFKKKSPIWFSLVYFGPIRSSLDNSINSINFSPLRSILVHFGPILSTLVYFCPRRTISAHSVHCDPLQSNSFHFCPFWSKSHFGPFWFNSIHFDSFLSTLVHFGLFQSL